MFLIYILPLAQLIKSYGVDTSGFADNSQLYVTFRKTNDTAAVQHQVKKLEQFLCDINTWMAQNMLKLNNSKTEIILFGSKKQLAQVNIQSLDVAGTVSEEPVRILGAMFDLNFTMVSRLNSVVKKASFHLRNIGKVRKLLTEDATKKVVQNLVISRINYCNALLSGIQQETLAKLQRLQNQAARIVTRTKWHKHITPVLEHLHWLPVKFRIDFKILFMAFKALNGFAPEYISQPLAIYKPNCTRRSGS